MVSLHAPGGRETVLPSNSRQAVNVLSLKSYQSWKQGTLAVHLHGYSKQNAYPVALHHTNGTYSKAIVKEKFFVRKCYLCLNVVTIIIGEMK